MDPIADIKFAKDSTLAMLLAAQARGFKLTYFEQRDLSLRDGRALGRARDLTVRADPESWFTLGEPRTMPLGELDVVLMRKDPPFDMEFIYTTYILDRAQEQGARSRLSGSFSIAPSIAILGATKTYAQRL